MAESERAADLGYVGGLRQQLEEQRAEMEDMRGEKRAAGRACVRPDCCPVTTDVVCHGSVVLFTALTARIGAAETAEKAAEVHGELSLRPRSRVHWHRGCR